MYAFSISACISILIASTVLWGLIPLLRKFKAKSVDTVTFAVVMTICQFMAGLVLWFIFGFATIDWEIEDSDIHNIFYVIASGMLGMSSDYIWFACFIYLIAMTNAAAAGVVSLIIGAMLDYAISQVNMNLNYLVFGIYLNVIGLVALVLVEVVSEPDTGDSDTSIYLSNCSNNEDEDDNEATLIAMKPNADTEAQLYSVEVAGRRFQGYSTYFYIGLSILSGCFFSGITVLSTFEESTTRPITDPTLVNLLYQTGRVAALPVCVYFFSHLELLGPVGPRVQSIGDIVSIFMLTDALDLSWVAAIGVLSSLGMVGYYVSVTQVSFAVSFAVLTSQTLITSLGSYLCGELDHISLVGNVLLGIGVSSYCLSVYILLRFAFV